MWGFFFRLAPNVLSAYLASRKSVIFVMLMKKRNIPTFYGVVGCVNLQLYMHTDAEAVHVHQTMNI